ncbi:hypothetical protein GQX74_013571 [Glossina fuscipes]|nr:hypothetical protein GQX74_013571 [Glossina fuscipes]
MKIILSMRTFSPDKGLGGSVSLGTGNRYRPGSKPIFEKNNLMFQIDWVSQLSLKRFYGFSNNTVSHFQHPSQFKHQPQRQRHQSTTISNHSTNTVTNNDTTITSSPCTTTTSNQDCIHNHTQQLSHTRHHHHHHHHHNLVAPLQPQQLSTSAHFDNFMLNEESFTCPQCFRTYRRHGTLRRHLRQECGKGKSMSSSTAKFYQQQMHQQALKQLQQQLQHQQQQQERLAVAISSPATVATIPIIDVEDNIKMNKINC